MVILAIISGRDALRVRQSTAFSVYALPMKTDDREVLIVIANAAGGQHSVNPCTPRMISKPIWYYNRIHTIRDVVARYVTNAGLVVLAGRVQVTVLCVPVG